ncbi:EcsC family protein [Gilliamella sp. B14384G15]|uniref:EcsC family protein n=1 Tax=unclassified Gilliamella TaxID=2685620 RepID=UPI0018DCB8CE|nr:MULTISPECIES: EcsC family protein [unclassified Gilliamella]MBI0031630.1 EcsC family protein [Gilliamella sp. B14384G15]MBI0058985.1 EcsC family protein [Gilliamella sp. B14384G12]
MTEKLNEGKIMQALNWAYDKALDGSIPGTDSSYELAENYLKGEADIVDKVNSLIRWQNTKSATTGFVSGLGGIITMPVAIPASIATVIYVQIRMVAAIAIMGEYDVKDDRVKTLVFSCLVGNAAKDILKGTGVVIGSKMTTQLIKGISKETIFAINKRVGFRLLTKFGEKGAINLGKMIPLVGGLIGATFDGISTNIIGNIARKTFIESGAITEP